MSRTINIWIVKRSSNEHFASSDENRVATPQGHGNPLWLRRDQANYVAIKRITSRSSELRRDQANYVAIKRIGVVEWLHRRVQHDKDLTAACPQCCFKKRN